MPATWIRLDVDYADDEDIDAAGWEAAAIWPRLICLMRQSKGALSDRQLAPRYLSRRLADMPEDVIERGVAGLKEAGKLLRGTCRYLGPGGRKKAVDGWVTRRLVEKGNGPTKDAVIEPLDVSNGVQVALPSATSHAGALCCAVLSGSVEPEESDARVDDWPSMLPADEPWDWGGFFRKHEHGSKPHARDERKVLALMDWVGADSARLDLLKDAAVRAEDAGDRPWSFLMSMVQPDGELRFRVRKQKPTAFQAVLTPEEEAAAIARGRASAGGSRR